MLTLSQLNAASKAEFTALLDGTYEHSPWMAETIHDQRPFASLAALKHAFAVALRKAGRDAQLKLIRAHPELAGKAMVSKTLTAESTNEQGKAGLTDCTPAEFAHLQDLNARYNAKFGFPFILAVRGPRGTGLDRHQIIAAFERRLAHHPDFELAESLRNIHRIAEIRLNDKFGTTPTLGQQAWDCAELLSQHSDPGYAEQGQLTVTYLTAAHQACQVQLKRWMHDCGFDDVSIDAVGNVVGVYHGTDRSADRSAMRLLTGSHYDTVRNGGKYDGRLGIFSALVCVRELHRAEREPPGGGSRSASRWSGSLKRKASATRPPSSVRAHSSASSTRRGSTSTTPTAFRCATRCARPAGPRRWRRFRRFAAIRPTISGLSKCTSNKARF
jgi:beta-ureidopropionase / N-carbamoyl-L-amino-acid hydrolase